MTTPHTQQAYTVAQGTSPIGVIIRQDRSPTSNDTQYLLNQLWLNTVDLSLWILVNFSSTNALLQAHWEPLSHGGFGDVAFLKGNTGGNVPPDINGVINVIGDGTTITIAGNPGTNTLTASLVGGLPALETLSDDVGTIVTPSADNIQLVGHINDQGGGKFSTVVAGTHLLNINPMSTSRWIVDPLGFNGTHTNISSAITSASAGDTIFIMPGTYTENLVVNKSLTFVSYGGDGRTVNTDTIIIGKITVIPSIICTFLRLSLQTNGDSILVNDGNSTVVVFDNCDLSINSSVIGIIQTGNAATNTYLIQSYVKIIAAGQLFSATNGALIVDETFIECPNLTSTASTISCNYYSTLSNYQTPIIFDDGPAIFKYCLFGSIFTPYTNVTYLSTTTSSGINLNFCNLYSGSQPVIDVGAGTLVTLSNCVINSSNTNTITGSGTLFYEGIVFSGVSSQFQNTLVLNLYGSTPSNSTSGFVWTSTGPNTSPTWQSVSSSGTVMDLAGNSGGNIPPSAGIINTVGTGSITIAGAGSTLTTQLTGLTNHNVLLGAGTATITKVAPSATSGVPLISQGAAADPTFGTAVVAGGGTGVTSFANTSALIASGTTTTGNLQNIASVATGQVLVSAGTSTLPTWSATPSISTITIGGGNALDSYVFGTFTPTLFGATTAGVTTYTDQVGTYCKIGAMVTVCVHVGISAATGTGGMLIGGIPYSPVANTSGIGAVNFNGPVFTWPAGTTHVFANLPSGVGSCLIQCNGSGTGVAPMQMSNNVLQLLFSMSFVSF